MAEVYIVISGEYSDQRIEYIASSEQNAKEFIARKRAELIKSEDKFRYYMDDYYVHGPYIIDSEEKVSKINYLTMFWCEYRIYHDSESEEAKANNGLHVKINRHEKNLEIESDEDFCIEPDTDSFNFEEGYKVFKFDGLIIRSEKLSDEKLEKIVQDSGYAFVSNYIMTNAPNAYKKPSPFVGSASFIPPESKLAALGIFSGEMARQELPSDKKEGEE